MNYRIEEKPEMLLTGFKRRFTGDPCDKQDQDHCFACETRVEQYVLEGMSREHEIIYTVMTDFTPEGYTGALVEGETDVWTVVPQIKLEAIAAIADVTYNAESMLEPTLHSVEEQTHRNVEHLIVDGNSSDNTLELVREYLERNGAEAERLREKLRKLTEM